MVRTCRECKKSEPEIKFYASRRTSVCARCENKARAERTRKNGQYIDRLPPEHRRPYALNAKLKSKYGITLVEYQEMLDQQGGACAICRNIPDDRRLCVDHDHTTGAIRGLLCDLCNRTLGQAGDSVALLQRMINYLS